MKQLQSINIFFLALCLFLSLCPWLSFFSYPEFFYYKNVQYVKNMAKLCRLILTLTYTLILKCLMHRHKVKIMRNWCWMHVKWCLKCKDYEDWLTLQLHSLSPTETVKCEGLCQHMFSRSLSLKDFQMVWLIRVHRSLLLSWFIHQMFSAINTSVWPVLTWHEQS